GGGLAQIGQLPFEFGDPTRETAVLECAVRETEVTEAEAETLVAQSLRGLASQASDLPANLGDHVGDSSEVLLRQRELGHRLPALRLVLRDARGLLEHRAAFLGFGREDLV